MHATACTTQLYGMLEVQHLVIDDVFDDRPRNGGVVENTAQHDGVVGWIIVAEAIAGLVCAPGQAWTGE